MDKEVTVQTLSLLLVSVLLNFPSFVECDGGGGGLVRIKVWRGQDTDKHGHAAFGYYVEQPSGGTGGYSFGHGDGSGNYKTQASEKRDKHKVDEENHKPSIARNAVEAPLQRIAVSEQDKNQKQQQRKEEKLVSDNSGEKATGHEKQDEDDDDYRDDYYSDEDSSYYYD